MAIILKHANQGNNLNTNHQDPPLKSSWRWFLLLVILSIGWLIYFFLLFDVIINNSQYLLKYGFYLAIAFIFILASSVVRLLINKNNNKQNQAKLSIADQSMNDNMDRDSFLDDSKAKEASKIIVKVNDAGEKYFCF